MTDSPSETTESSLDAFASSFAESVSATGWSADFETIHIYVNPDQWVDAATAAREAGLDFFSWLSAVDWAKEVTVGEPVADVENLEERYEVLCRLSASENSDALILSTSLGKDDPALDSLTSLYGGAEWHERETAEMFGIDFHGHPNLVNLYLPEAFEGHPLRKSFALGAREVKPWPGHIDVEDLPSTENVEAAAQDGEGS